jgi:hypothetical protein
MTNKGGSAAAGGKQRRIIAVAILEHVELKNPFFDIVHIEEELHFTRWTAGLRDIAFEVFLDLRREIAKEQTTHFVVPFDDRSSIPLRRVFLDPAINLLIGCAARNELFEFTASSPVNFQK